jgi:hypothetical protein
MVITTKPDYIAFVQFCQEQIVKLGETAGILPDILLHKPFYKKILRCKKQS